MKENNVIEEEKCSKNTFSIICNTFLALWCYFLTLKTFLHLVVEWGYIRKKTDVLYKYIFSKLLRQAQVVPSLGIVWKKQIEP